ncbi:RING-H2 finger protein ATL34-like [Gastrolobium bilobum]|uniref:RING-H2 finger protein ATL34-like n=1 Tax=Gastrolobium bilobum TaxID=150636 RepID=UPI002AB2A4E0|nr:RING-H2 finger protein ATL34-like [Gastrolobium bilobum]
MSIQKESPLRLRRFDNHGNAWLVLLLIQISPPATAQTAAPPVDPNNNKSVAAIMGIVAFMFLISGLLSLYSRKCGDRRGQIRGRIDLTLPTGGSGRRSQNEPRGLNQEVIDTFPTFLYSNVKDLKIGKGTLACAVCLNEFQDDETLRMIPKCSHVYHPTCIDVWLSSHSTCPVCRANLVPKPDDNNNNNNNMCMPPMVSIQIPDDHDYDHEQQHHLNAEENTGEDQKRENNVDLESPNVDFLRRSRTMNYQNRPTRSRSTGFLFALLFPRSNSTGSVLLQPGENCERFTLRLPDEVRSQMLNSTLKRTNSCVSFTSMSSGTRGYRTRSVGSGRGFGCEEHWGFTLTPPFIRNSCNRSARKSPVQCSSGVALDNNVGERSSDLLCPG